MIGMTLLIALGGISLPPATPEGPAAQVPAPAQPQDKSEKRVCRSINTTGSRIASLRLCKTQAEWDRWADEWREAVQYVLHRPTGDPTNPLH
jgi:hypothetical protein